jgi:hypothetical protein
MRDATRLDEMEEDMDTSFDPILVISPSYFVDE